MSTRYDQDTGEYSLFVNGKFVPVAVRYSDKLPPDATPFYPRKPFSEAMHAAVVAEVAKFSKLALESKLVQGHLCWLVSRTDRQHDYDYSGPESPRHRKAAALFHSV